MDDIILQESNKLSAEYEAHGNIDSEIDKNYIYMIDNMSPGENKENTEWRKRVFERKLENTYEIEIQNGMNCLHENEINKISE